MQLPGTVLLSGIVGSTAHGLAGPGSDVDRLGLYATPTLALLGLKTPKESHVQTDPDVTFHEAGKAARLILDGNPTASELLWLPDDLYEVRTPLGDEAIAIRTAFLREPRPQRLPRLRAAAVPKAALARPRRPGGARREARPAPDAAGESGV